LGRIISSFILLLNNIRRLFVGIDSSGFKLSNASQYYTDKARLHTALLGSESVIDLPTIMASEDFSQYGLPGRHHYGEEPIPYCVWEFGGHSRERYNAAPGDRLMAKMPYLPSNHQSNFAPDPEPTLRVGVYALTSAALAYLPAAAGFVDKTT
jgi:hippurate hydrolase